MSHSLTIVFGAKAVDYAYNELEYLRKAGRIDIVDKFVSDSDKLSDINFMLYYTDSKPDLVDTEPDKVIRYIDDVERFREPSTSSVELVRELLDFYSNDSGTWNITTIIADDIMDDSVIKYISSETISDTTFYTVKNPTGVTLVEPDWVGANYGIALASSDYHIRLDKSAFNCSAKSLPRRPLVIEPLAPDESVEENNTITATLESTNNSEIVECLQTIISLLDDIEKNTRKDKRSLWERIFGK